MTPPDELPLAAEFPAATREQWRKLVESVLKGAPFDKRLVAKTYDGLAVEPLYGRVADAQPVTGRAPGTPWSIVQRVDHPEPAAANAEALNDLENGATGLALVFAGAVGAYGYGLPAHRGGTRACARRRPPRCRHRPRARSRSGRPRYARPGSPHWSNAAVLRPAPRPSVSASTRSGPRPRVAAAACPGAGWRRCSMPRFPISAGKASAAHLHAPTAA